MIPDTNINDTEKAFISAVLHDEEILYRTPIQPEDMLDLNHRLILESCRKLSGQGIKPDLVAVCNDLKESVSPAVIGDITSMGAMHANWKFYTDKLINNIMFRRLQRFPDFTKELLNTVDNPREIIRDAGEYLDKVQLNFSEYKITKASDIVPEWHEEINKRIECHGDLQPGVQSGFPTIDRVTGGFQDRHLTYIGARPSQGKSAILYNFTLKALTDNVPAGIITVESSKKEILSRMASTRAHVPLTKLKTGLVSTSQRAEYDMAASWLYGAPLYFYDEPNADINTVIAQARRMVSVYQVKILFVDYAQLIQPSNRSVSRVEQVSEISIKLKAMARDLDIPVVCAAQLRRDADGRAPALSDFADSSQIEKDADVAILIQHKKAESEDQEEQTFLHVDKNRDGEKASFKVHFAKEFVEFKEIEERSPF